MTAPSKPKSSKVVWLLALGLAIPLFVYLMALGLPGFGSFRSRKQVAEAMLNVRTLCRLTLRHHEQNKGVWRTAGPVPTEVPKGEAVQFVPDEGFKAIGFDPGEVRYQYEVTVQPDIIRCTARGDLDGDGVQSNIAIGIVPDSKELTGTDVRDETE